MSKTITIDQDVPKPLEPLTLLKVDDQNQKIEAATLEERLRRLEPTLSSGERRRLTRRRKKLHKLLNKIGWNDLCQERGNLWGRYLDAVDRMAAIGEQLIATVEIEPKQLEALTQKYRAAKAKARENAQGGKQVQAEISKFQSDYDSYSEAVRLLDAHEQALNYQQEDAQNRKQFYSEAEWYESLLLSTFRNSARCHYLGKDRKGREYRVVPRFQRIKVDSDTIWYLLETSQRTPFGWKLLLPYDVHVEDLTSDETLEDMKAATGRQVEVVRGKKSPAIWYVVHRLDSPDGLPMFVPYKQLLAHYPSEKHNVLPFPVGVKSGRIAEWQYFGEKYHLLIGGSSGSGKSNLINCIISTLITMNSPRECRLLLIDLKGGIELGHFAGVPHIIQTTIRDEDGKRTDRTIGTIKQVDDLLPALEHINGVMFKRFDCLAASNCKEILEYNTLMPDERRMARIVLVFDEMATFLSRGKVTHRIHDILREITGKGRAVGIHSILCNQYTDVEAVPSFIKANLSIKITGSATSGGASMTALNTHSAKNLPSIPGRMIEGIGAEEVTFQAAYISVLEIAEAVARARLFGDAPELDSFPAWEPVPEPEPIELSERERMVLEVLAKLEDSESKSERWIARQTDIPQGSIHRVMATLAEKASVGMISGSYAITMQGRLALTHITTASGDTSPKITDASNASAIESITVIAPETVAVSDIESLEVEAVTAKAYVKITPSGTVHRNGYHPRADRAAQRAAGRDAGGLLPESAGVLLAGESVEGLGR
jgi:hypothetical protein